MSLNFCINSRVVVLLVSLSSIANMALAQDQVLEKYAMCLATLHALNTLGDSQKSEIDSRIKRVQSSAFAYIKKRSPTVNELDLNADIFSKNFERNMDYYAQAAQLGGYSLVIKAIEPNIRSCD